MARPVERLFTIDEMIRSGEYPSIQEFKQRFTISERAAYADIQYLKRRFQAPIGYSRKHGGYYYTLKGWCLAAYDRTGQQERVHQAATTWLWNEIVRRFGQEAATALYRDFLQRLLPTADPWK